MEKKSVGKTIDEQSHESESESEKFELDVSDKKKTVKG